MSEVKTFQRMSIFGTITSIKRQMVTLDGQIRYKIIMDDVPLESMDFISLRTAMENGTRLYFDKIEEA